MDKVRQELDACNKAIWWWELILKHHPTGPLAEDATRELANARARHTELIEGCLR